MDQITRRKFLKIAGGITFLSLTPIGKGLFAAPEATTPLPLFTVIPYIQPGSASKLVDGQDTLVVAWQTESLPAQFEVRYGSGKLLDKTAKIVIGRRAISGASRGRRQRLLQQADQLQCALIEPQTEYEVSIPGGWQRSGDCRGVCDHSKAAGNCNKIRRIWGQFQWRYQ